MLRSPGPSLALVGAALSLLLLEINRSYACNEAVCASIVSKCMLTQSCKCDLSTCSCCKECFLCLSLWYNECCSCVELCPKPNITYQPLSRLSHVEEFSDSMPGLFQALTEEPDEHGRWISLTYPIDLNVTLFSPKKDDEMQYQIQDADRETHPLKPNIITVNCTVAYKTNCTSWQKCKRACQSMGASSYRWFHDGCCECIGNTCVNYGINESRCLHCPRHKKDDLRDDYDDYGQDDEFSDDEFV